MLPATRGRLSLWRELIARQAPRGNSVLGRFLYIVDQEGLSGFGQRPELSTVGDLAGVECGPGGEDHRAGDPEDETKSDEVRGGDFNPRYPSASDNGKGVMTILLGSTCERCVVVARGSRRDFSVQNI